MFVLSSTNLGQSKLTNQNQFEEKRQAEKSVKRGIEANEETLDA
jgi:hypothetical protein